MLRFKLMFLTILSLIQMGCGLQVVVIPNLDWLVARKVNDNLHLKSEQKRVLQGDISKWLESIKPQVKNIRHKASEWDLKKIDVLKESQWIQKEYEQMTHEFSSVLAKHIASFDSDQIEKFKRSNSKKIKRFQRKLWIVKLFLKSLKGLSVI